MRKFLRSTITLALASLVGLVLAMDSARAALPPITCEAQDQARNASIEKRQKAVDESVEYKNVLDNMNAKTKCLADLSSIMGRNVGVGGGALGDIVNQLESTMRDGACDKAAEMAAQAERRAMDEVNKVTGEAVGEVKAAAQDAFNPDAQIRLEVEKRVQAEAEAKRIALEKMAEQARNQSGANGGYNSSPSIYDLLAKLY